MTRHTTYLIQVRRNLGRWVDYLPIEGSSSGRERTELLNSYRAHVSSAQFRLLRRIVIEEVLDGEGDA